MLFPLDIDIFFIDISLKISDIDIRLDNHHHFSRHIQNTKEFLRNTKYFFGINGLKYVHRGCVKCTSWFITTTIENFETVHHVDGNIIIKFKSK